MRTLLLALALCCAHTGHARGQDSAGAEELRETENPHSQVAPAHGQVQLLEHSARSNHPTLGSESAPVTIEFFLNLGNGRTYRPHLEIMKLAARHPKRLRVIYRLTDRSERSSNAAQIFGREAFEQGRFFEFMEAYYGKHKRHPSSKEYPEVAKESGVNYERVKRAMESMRHDEVLGDNHYYWKRMHVTRVPGILVNGRPFSRINTVDQLEELYNQAYEEAMQHLSKGVAISELRSALLRSRLSSSPDYTPRASGPLDGEPHENPPKTPVPIRIGKCLKGPHRQGPEDAKVTLIFMCHLQSLLCRTMSKHLQTLRRAYGDDVQLIFHPLFDSERPGQDKASLMYEATLCADEQDAFWDYAQYAYDQQRRINFDQSLAIELAASPALELNVETFESCLDTGRFSAQVEAEVAQVRRSGVHHTPALAVSGLLYSGRMHFEDLRVLVDSELAPGVLESLSGP